MDTSCLHALACILCLVLVLGTAPSFAAPARAQESTPVRTDTLARNSIYVELLGSGILYSLNYDRRFTDRVSGRAGLMAIGAKNNHGEEVALALVPLLANYLAGHGSHRLELGAGPVLAYANGRIDADEVEGLDEFSNFGLLVGANVSYRYQLLRDGFVFRIGFTPLLSRQTPIPTDGISFGYAF